MSDNEFKIPTPRYRGESIQTRSRNRLNRFVRDTGINEESFVDMSVRRDNIQDIRLLIDADPAKYVSKIILKIIEYRK